MAVARGLARGAAHLATLGASGIMLGNGVTTPSSSDTDTASLQISFDRLVSLACLIHASTAPGGRGTKGSVKHDRPHRHERLQL